MRPERACQEAVHEHEPEDERHLRELAAVDVENNVDVHDAEVQENARHHVLAPLSPSVLRNKTDHLI